MSHSSSHRLEKIAVQLTSAAALCAVYFGLWRIYQPSDPLAPVSFLAAGAYGAGIRFVLTIWALAAACAVTTLSSRREGALLAALIGAGGVSLHSPSIRPLLWEQNGALGGLYAGLMLEIVLLTVALAVAWGIVQLVRAVAGRLRPAWLWADPLADLPASQRPPESAAQGVLCAGMATVLSIVLLQVLARSPERGQILFALVASFAIGTLAGHHLFPTRSSLAALVPAPVAAILMYALAAFTPIPDTPDGWAQAPLYAQALPIDWMTAGAGGAVLGYWISARIHELRLLEKFPGRQEQEHA